jgi:hypothetical protein
MCFLGLLLRHSRTYEGWLKRRAPCKKIDWSNHNCYPTFVACSNGFWCSLFTFKTWENENILHISLKNTISCPHSNLCFWQDRDFDRIRSFCFGFCSNKLRRRQKFFLRFPNLNWKVIPSIMVEIWRKLKAKKMQFSAHDGSYGGHSCYHLAEGRKRW